MAREYEALAKMLRGRSEPIVEVTFRELDQLVGGLPDSARKYAAWWANTYTAQPHSRHWLDAGRRAQPNFNGQRVKFEIGAASTPRTRDATSVKSFEHAARLEPTRQVEEATVRFEWLNAGDIHLDRSGKPVFPGLPSRAGIYRFSLTDAEGSLVGVYIGESVNLARRMVSYRTPGPTQPTNQRLNTRMCELLASGGRTTLAVSLEATADGEPLDLTARPGRLLAENIGLVHAARRGDPVENL